MITRKVRLNSLLMMLNGGPGSGNPNPGQGRGIGKPAGGSGRGGYVFDGPKTVKKASEELEKVAQYSGGIGQYFEYESEHDKEHKKELINTLNSMTKVLKDAKNAGVDTDNIFLTIENVGVFSIEGMQNTLAMTKAFDLSGMIDGDGGTAVSLNPGLDFVNNKEILNKFKEGENQFHVAESAVSAFRHELGHVATHQLLHLDVTDTADRYKYEKLVEPLIHEAFGKEKIRSLEKEKSKLKLREDIKNMQIANGFGKDFEYLTKMKISTYGTFSPAEFIAESWCNSDFSEDTKTMHDYMVERLRNKKANDEYEELNSFQKEKIGMNLCVGYTKTEDDFVKLKT